jgi:hypothetical protein
MVMKFQFYYELFGNGKPQSLEEKTRLQNWIHGERQRDQDSRIKRQWAWNNLFAKLTTDDILIELNHVWIDPAYRIVRNINPDCKVVFTAVRVSDSIFL